jgi:hypothetical protein
VHALVRQLSAPITLRDGRTIATLGQAREMMFSLPPASRSKSTWRIAASLLSESAADNSHAKLVDAETELSLALKIERLL